MDRILAGYRPFTGLEYNVNLAYSPEMGAMSPSKRACPCIWAWCWYSLPDT